MYPRVGGRSETFILRFVAPEPTQHDGPRLQRTFYEFRGSGPRGCGRVHRGVIDGPDERRGDPVAIDIVPEAAGGNKARWCVGRYRGQVFFVALDEEGSETSARPVGRKISFRVVSSGGRVSRVED